MEDSKRCPKCKGIMKRVDQYILSDYKNYGSYKVAKCLGISIEPIEETILDEDNKPLLLKSGPNKGMPKTKKKNIITIDPSKIDMKDIEYQLNRYRIFFEQHGFPISQMRIQVMVRDGGTYIAKNRGIDKNLYIIPIKRLLNNDVLGFYKELNGLVMSAFKTGFSRKCNAWESWERRRCEGGYCEVVKQCRQMSEKKGERWGLI